MKSESLDGMAVREGISYQKHSDTLVGFADYGSQEESNTNIPADQGVVLMIRGLTLRWKQVIGYYLTRHNISTCTLKNIIFDAVKQLTSLGLSVEALVMDQESLQWKFIKDVGVSIEKPYFTAVEDKKCHIIPDPPHLIKNLRNNFKTKDIFYVLHGVKGKARWNHLEQLYKLNRSNHIHAVPHLQDDHFLLPQGKKMVILACQILSDSVASALKFYVCKNLLPPEVKETADFIEMVNSMWDFIDSHSLSAPTGKKPVSVRTYEEDMERFDFFYAFVSSFKFVRTGDGKEIKLPSHCGWLLALKSLKALSTHLLKEEKILTHLCLRKCNQDHVENLHSQIRNYKGFNDHPKAESYINALRCLACSSSTTELLDKTISAGANCLSDKEASPYTISPPDAVTYKSFSARQTDLEESNSEGPTLEWELGVLELEGKQLGEVEKEIVNYIAGSVVRKLNNNHLEGA
ncbi:transposable element p transposase [Plakobranchus ocellatus]|uniref:Transposable element p transposase n=1 Tax=Plakobranchus ocellatus TaxID=259542 RepID=A0AAV3ZF54_9GAST|nr:transposable element p transposase [Plakobranchus ocellatus]